MIERVKEFNAFGATQKEVLKALDENPFRHGGPESGWIWDTDANTVKLLRTLAKYDVILGFPDENGEPSDRVIRVVELRKEHFELQDRVNGKQWKTYPRGDADEMTELDEDDTESVEPEEDSIEEVESDDLPVWVKIKLAQLEKIEENRAKSVDTPTISAKAAPVVKTPPVALPSTPKAPKNVAFVALMNGTQCYVGRMVRGKASHAIVYTGEMRMCIEVAKKWNRERGLSPDEVVEIMDSTV